MKQALKFHFLPTLLLFIITTPIFAQVGIGTTDPKGALHIYEATGSPATATKGSIILEHNNNGGSSSIIFKSKSNANSDFGFINYSDNGSGDATTTEKSLLTIGTENDVPGIYEDNINIAAKGSLGINNIKPNASASIDMGQTDRGILINRVNISSLTATTPINNPAIGLMVFNTNTTTGQGFHYWNGTKWVRINDSTIPSDNTNFASDDLTQDAETRTYNINNQDLNFTNGSFGLNKTNPTGTLDAESTLNEDAFRFVQGNNLTGEKDVFTVEDQDDAGGGQDHSSVLKVIKSGSISGGADGLSLIELTSTGTDPGANKYWISGRKVDEGAPLWGVDITDSDYWSQGGIQLGVTTNGNGTYSGGNFIVKNNGDTGIGNINPMARLHAETNLNTKPALVAEITATNSNFAAGEFYNPKTTDGLGVYGSGFYGLFGATTDIVDGWAGYFQGDIRVVNDAYANSYITWSDRRIKKNIVKIDNALNILASLNPTKYEKGNFNANTAKSIFPTTINKKKFSTEYGLIAQEVENVLPDLVSKKAITTKDFGEVELKGVNYTGLIPILIKATQEQQLLINDQEKKNSRAKSKNRFASKKC